MPRTRSPHLVVLTVTLGCAVVLGLAACGPRAQSPEVQPTPEATKPDVTSDQGTAGIPETDAARSLVEAKCAGCHDLDRVWAASKDAAGWDLTVKRMEDNGLELSGDEHLMMIVDYLASQ